MKEGVRMEYASMLREMRETGHRGLLIRSKVSGADMTIQIGYKRRTTKLFFSSLSVR